MAESSQGLTTAARSLGVVATAGVTATMGQGRAGGQAAGATAGAMADAEVRHTGTRQEARSSYHQDRQSAQPVGRAQLAATELRRDCSEYGTDRGPDVSDGAGL